jgi:hypothetical protein
MTRQAKNPGFTATQKAIYGAIVAVPLTVYDEAPENAAFPYVSIGESNTIDAGNKTNHADDHYETIHVWSRAKGFKECKDMAGKVIKALSEKTFLETGYIIKFFEIDQVNFLRDPDGLTRHGVIRIKFKVLQE